MTGTPTHPSASPATVDGGPSRGPDRNRAGDGCGWTCRQARAYPASNAGASSQWCFPSL